jgi:hypothetical protein
LRDKEGKERLKAVGNIFGNYFVDHIEKIYRPKFTRVFDLVLFWDQS